MAILLSQTEKLDELLKGQAHIWRQALSFAGPLSLKCAIELGIPDVIHKHGRPLTMKELVDALKINKAKSDELYRVMRILTLLGFFVKEKVAVNGVVNQEVNGVVNQEEEGEAYSLTPFCRLLVENHPFSMKPLVLLQLDPAFMESFHHLSKWFTNDDPTAFYTSRGVSFWEEKSQDEKFMDSFDEGMAKDTPFIVSVISEECKHVFEGIDSLVDVGGGTGTFAKSILDVFPHIHCTVLDLPSVVAGLEGTENLKYVGGDMFFYIPPAHSILLKTVLHDWTDEESVQILKKCKGAITSKGKGGGKVIIIDLVVDIQKIDHKSIETQLYLDMLMLTAIRGKERTEKQWAKLFCDAGFTSYKITHFSSVRSIIEVYP